MPWGPRAGPRECPECPDDSVEFRELGDAVDDGGDAAGIVAQTIVGGLAGGCEHALEVRLAPVDGATNPTDIVKLRTVHVAAVYLDTPLDMPTDGPAEEPAEYFVLDY